MRRLFGVLYNCLSLSQEGRLEHICTTINADFILITSTGLSELLDQNYHTRVIEDYIVIFSGGDEGDFPAKPVAARSAYIKDTHRRQ